MKFLEALQQSIETGKHAVGPKGSGITQTGEKYIALDLANPDRASITIGVFQKPVGAVSLDFLLSDDWFLVDENEAYYIEGYRRDDNISEPIIIEENWLSLDNALEVYYKLLLTCSDNEEYHICNSFIRWNEDGSIKWFEPEPKFSNYFTEVFSKYF